MVYWPEARVIGQKAVRGQLAASGLRVRLGTWQKV
jgi:hypothetical protein